MRNNPQLEQDPMFIERIVPYDFTKNMGQYAVEIYYTNGRKDVFTTKMPPEIGNDPGDFDTFDDMKKFIEDLERKRHK
jgi:hypothetical protein